MHCEKNLCENMTKTVLALKESYGSREDLRELGIREELWLQPPQNNREIFHIPSAPYALRGFQKTTVMDIIRNLKTPSNYVGAIHKCLEEGRLRYMKSHDYHVLMHQVRQQLLKFISNGHVIILKILKSITYGKPQYFTNGSMLDSGLWIMEV